MAGVLALGYYVGADSKTAGPAGMNRSEPEIIDALRGEYSTDCDGGAGEPRGSVPDRICRFAAQFAQAYCKHKYTSAETEAAKPMCGRPGLQCEREEAHTEFTFRAANECRAGMSGAEPESMDAKIEDPKDESEGGAGNRAARGALRRLTVISRTPTHSSISHAGGPFNQDERQRYCVPI